MFCYSKLLIALSALSCAQLGAVEVREPEGATGFVQKTEKIGKQYMAVTANPYASNAAKEILAKGGSAVDAAIAAQLVLTLVEPQSSGIGGGLFSLIWNEKNKSLVTLDGRETAPASANETLFLNPDGKPIRWIDAVVGGRSVGVPSAINALNKMHQAHGKLPWQTLFEPAITLAENGFIVSPRLAKLVAMKYNPGLDKYPPTKAYFFPNDEPLKAGTLKKNLPLANLYRDIAKHGPSAFYTGTNARALVSTVKNNGIAVGTLELTDLTSYQAKLREPVCAPYKQFKVCTMGPPSSGGITVLQLIKQLEHLKQQPEKKWQGDYIHAFAQSSRLAFADRNHYIADPDFVDVPVNEMLAPSYLRYRASLIGNTDLGQVSPGTFNASVAYYQKDDSFELPSTSHLSIIDSDGNAVSMTTSIEMAFGSTLMVNGYLLNNQLTDFALSPTKDGVPVANRVEPNKRPRSSMSPVMVFDSNNKLVMLVGSPGGSRIINYVAKTIVGKLDLGLDLQSAINLPNVTNRNDVTTLEKDTLIESELNSLQTRGHTVRISDLNSGIHAIWIENGTYYGAADPRREGLAVSELSQ